MSRSPTILSLTIAALLGVASQATAQVCLGLAAGDGAVTYGFEGSDGAIGDGAELTVVRDRLSFSAGRTTLDKFAQADDVRTSRLRTAWVAADGAVQLCALAAAEWQSYEATAYERRHRSADEPDIEWAEYAVTGQFNRVRLPVGLALGREFVPVGRLGINPFAGVGVAYDHERMHYVDGTDGTRSNLGIDTRVGLAFRLGPLLLRSQVRNVWGADQTMAGNSDFLAASVHVGWVF